MGYNSLDRVAPERFVESDVSLESLRTYAF